MTKSKRTKEEIEKFRQEHREKLIAQNMQLRVKDHETPEARKAQIEHLKKTADKHLEKAKRLEGPLKEKWNKVAQKFLEKAKQVEKSL